MKTITGMCVQVDSSEFPTFKVLVDIKDGAEMYKEVLRIKVDEGTELCRDAIIVTATIMGFAQYHRADNPDMMANAFALWRDSKDVWYQIDGQKWEKVNLNDIRYQDYLPSA